MHREIKITNRVKVVIYDGEPPYPQRVHYVVAVDRHVVWHQTSNPHGAQHNLQPLAEYIARKEAMYLETGAKRDQ